ncbi:MAG: T9SS type A sorting domain-containing protein [Bacteroidetes bacterium]|nr:T9SS type A sorting domain-containing protein [Bacteroidota bacterium]
MNRFIIPVFIIFLMADTLVFSRQWNFFRNPNPDAGRNLLRGVRANLSNDVRAIGEAAGVPVPTTGTLVSHWNCSDWNIESAPNQSNNRSNYITKINGLSSDDIGASGYSRVISGTYQAMKLDKTGSDWNLVMVPQPGLENFLYQIDIIAADNIRVAGQYNDGTQYRPFFLHYNGSSWTIESSPGGGAGIVHNSSDDIWSSGSGFVHYDGIAWNSESAPVPYGGSMLHMSRVSAADIWAVGRYLDGDNFKTLTMHFENSVSVSNSNTLITGHKLHQNYPNPFNPVTNLEFEISPSLQSGKSVYVTLKIYDITGKEVATIADANFNPGKYKYQFDASGLQSGTYFYKMSAEGFTETKRLVLLK